MSSISAEWVAVGVSIVGALGVFANMWQNMNVQLTLSKMREEVSSLKLWTHENFVAKKSN